MTMMMVVFVFFFDVPDDDDDGVIHDAYPVAAAAVRAILLFLCSHPNKNYATDV